MSKEAIVFLFHQGKYAVSVETYEQILELQKQFETNGLIIRILDWFEDGTTDEDKNYDLERWRKIFMMAIGKYKGE